MSKILVSAHYDTDGTLMPYPHISSYYCRAISACGGVPLIASLAPADDLAQTTDALVLTGGGDLCPENYSYNIPLELIKTSGLARDLYEMELFRAFLNAKKPILGICRGMQLINIMLDGTLIEDIKYERGESCHSGGIFHNIEIYKNSWLFDIFGSKIRVNSYHHQACLEMGAGLLACARSEDGIIEAFTHEELPVYGVQWHPERMYVSGERDDEHMSLVFKYFTDIVARRK